MMHWGKILGAAATMAVLAGCQSTGSGSDKAEVLPQSDARAHLTDAQGADRGRVDIYRTASGLRLEIVARGFAAGSYGMHIHTTGRCDAPGFTTAGGHWNPTSRQHGRENPMGAHHGDMPNLVVTSDEIGRATVDLVGSRFEGEGGLFDADGAAFVIHAGPDDYRSDPAGNSGARVACGVLTRD
jgi:Cu-Zn family superoxide dismutase